MTLCLERGWSAAGLRPCLCKRQARKMAQGAASASVGSGRLCMQRPHCPAPPWPLLVSSAADW